MHIPPLSFDSSYLVADAVSAAERWCKITGQAVYVVAAPQVDGQSMRSRPLTILLQEQMNTIKLTRQHTVRYCTG